MTGSRQGQGRHWREVKVDKEFKTDINWGQLEVDKVYKVLLALLDSYQTRKKQQKYTKTKHKPTRTSQKKQIQSNPTKTNQKAI